MEQMTFEQTRDLELLRHTADILKRESADRNFTKTQWRSTAANIYAALRGANKDSK